jgi:hypothetical protein
MMPRRFPSPWSIEEGSACFIVRDHDKQALALRWAKHNRPRLVFNGQIEISGRW